VVVALSAVNSCTISAKGMNPNIFREYDIRGVVGTDLTAETVNAIANGIAVFFLENGVGRVAIGFDARESSPVFRDILVAVLRAAGLQLMDIGLVPTPVLYHVCHTGDVEGGVMITGSHNPADHNGFKICVGTHTIFGDEVQRIHELVRSILPPSAGEAVVKTYDPLPSYKADVVSRTKMGTRRLKVVIDAGHGTGGITAVPVYRSLGCEVIELFTVPDPTFPAHHPDPTVEENLQDLIEAVREHNADVGIAFDGDADRIGVVDENGTILWGDQLTALFARQILRENRGATIIGEVKCSKTLFEDVERNGGRPLMWKAGHSLIKAKMKETGAVLAGEMSGHIFFADRYYGFDDACYAGARLLEILSATDRPLSQLTEGMGNTHSTPELRVPCPEELKIPVLARVIDHYEPDHEVITIDGARITFNNGWGLVRPSNTQAILVLRFEAATEESLAMIRRDVESFVQTAVARAAG
jgi:phosphomannomutase / phosphoglucomutase